MSVWIHGILTLLKMKRKDIFPDMFIKKSLNLTQKTLNLPDSNECPYLSDSGLLIPFLTNSFPTEMGAGTVLQDLRTPIWSYPKARTVRVTAKGPRGPWKDVPSVQSGEILTFSKNNNYRELKRVT